MGNIDYVCLQPATLAANVRAVFTCLLDEVSDKFNC